MIDGASIRSTFGLAFSTAAFGVNIVSERDARMSNQDRRIDSIERKTESAAEMIKNIDARQTVQRQTYDTQVQALRAEIRSDLRDINNKLDTLMLSQIQKPSIGRPE